MKYVKKLIGDRIYLSPRSIEDAEIFVECENILYYLFDCLCKGYC